MNSSYSWGFTSQLEAKSAQKNSHLMERKDQKDKHL